MVDKTIEKVYNEFFGNIRDTYTQAKEKDPTIKYEDVKKWFEKNQVRKTNLTGYNSFIARYPKQEYQIDLFFMTENPDDEYKIALMMIDIFSKFMEVIPIKSKQPKDILEALEEGFKNMGGKPESIYSDDEGSLNSKLLESYFKERDIQRIVTRGHAAFAERGVRTIKSMLDKRLEKNPDSHWYDANILANALVTYNYKMIHSATRFTPAQAREPKNKLDVKFNLELKRKHNRVYPDVKEGDKVRMYKKKSKFAKERVGVWTDTIHTVERIEERNNQDFYYVKDRDRPLLRNEILKVT